MDFHALQQKLFEMDPTDPREDLAKLQAAAQGGAVASDVTPARDYVNESVEVAEGSLKLDKDYSINDFAALAGVVTERKQKPADHVRGAEPMPAAKPGRTEHPFKNRLVGEDDESTPLQGFDADTISALKQIKAKYPYAPDELSALLKYVSRISKHSKDEDHMIEERLAAIEKRLDRIEAEIKKPKTESIKRTSVKREGYDSIKSELFARLAEVEKKYK